MTCHLKDREHYVASNGRILRHLNALSEISQCSVFATIYLYVNCIFLFVDMSTQTILFDDDCVKYPAVNNMEIGKT